MKPDDGRGRGATRTKQFNARVGDETIALAKMLIEKFSARDKRKWSQADLVIFAIGELAEAQHGKGGQHDPEDTSGERRPRRRRRCDAREHITYGGDYQSTKSPLIVTVAALLGVGMGLQRSCGATAPRSAQQRWCCAC